MTRGARILIIDDEPGNVRAIQRLLRRAGYHQIRASTDSRDAIVLVEEFHPDLILLDLHMPELDGFAVLESLQPYFTGTSYLPVLVLTGDTTDAATQAALSKGARDLLAKPFRPAELVLRVRNLLETRFLHDLLQRQNQTLEESVRQRTRELERAQFEVLDRLARAAEFRDDNTGQHTRRVGDVAAKLAAALHLPAEATEIVRRAAPLHDVGKIGIPDAILLKPGILTLREREIMRTHTSIGAQLLSGGSSVLVRTAELIALNHHECWDGSGYPQGLSREQIPIEARLVAVADYMDALTHDRPYRRAWPLDRVLEAIRLGRGRQFDPAVADALLALHGQGALQPELQAPLEPEAAR